MRPELEEFVQSLPSLTWLPDEDYLQFFALLYEHFHKRWYHGMFREIADVLVSHRDPSPFKTTLYDAYLGKYNTFFTELSPLYNIKLNAPIHDQKRFMGTYLLALSGSGKTTLIENLVARDMERVSRGDASVLVMDGQGRKEMLGRLADTYDHVMIDSTTPLNIFALPRMPETQREAEILRTNAASLVTDIFSVRLGGMPFTPKQKVPFNFCTQLVMEVGGNIHDMYTLMQPNGLSNYTNAIPRLSPSAQLFFSTQFDDPKQFSDTKKEIVLRLDGVMSVPAFARMFTAKNPLDLHTLLMKPQLILVDTDTNLLGRDGTAVFGRFIINMLVLSGIQRLELPPQKRLDSYVYVDEAGDYIADDANVEYIVDKFRKARIATFWALQRDGNIKNGSVLDALRNCAIRITSQADYRFLYEVRGEPSIVISSPPVNRPKRKVRKTKPPPIITPPPPPPLSTVDDDDDISPR